MIRNIYIAFVLCTTVVESSALLTNRTQRSNTCGVSRSETGLIVRGQSFPRGSFPWIVALLHTGTRPPQFFCGGTLISKTFVISAAHCILDKQATQKFLPRDILALFGAHDLSNSFESERIAISPRKIFIHDDWNHLTTSFDADISLLEFQTNKIHFSGYIQPICLWGSKIEPTTTDGIVTGWGKSEDPTKIHENLPKLLSAPIQANEDCFLNQKSLVDISSKRTFCAGLRNGSGVCNGDSGGGLFIKVNEVFYLKGIVSSSLIKDEGCDISKDAVYTNVFRFTDWIKKIIADATGTLDSVNKPFLQETTTQHSLNVIQSLTTILPSVPTQTLKDVFCTFTLVDEWYYGKMKTCELKQNLDSENYVLASPFNITVQKFSIKENREVKFLPKQIGDKFQNLLDLQTTSCGLTVVRKQYFQKMKKLLSLSLADNEISSIEADSFSDLISVQVLNLNYNAIETLDSSIFYPMISLQEFLLSDNKIKSLSPKTFLIPGGKLRKIHIEPDVCLKFIPRKYC